MVLWLLQVLTSQLSQLVARVAVLEHSCMQGEVPGTQRSSVNPLFFEDGSPQVWGWVGGPGGGEGWSDQPVGGGIP